MREKKTQKIDVSRGRIAKLADKYYNEGKYIPALRLAHRELQEFGGDPDVFARLCDIYEVMGLQGSAINYWFRFLDIAAQCNGEIINYSNIAQDCGVSAVTVKEYFTILQQTLIGYLIPAFTASKKRRAITAPRFYYFDVGIVNHLLRRGTLQQGSVDYGHAFEHLMIQELVAYLSYSESDEQLSYWRTSSGYEVDAVIGNGRVAIEFKSSDEVQSKHTKGLKAFSEECPDSRLIIVSMDANPRLLNNVEVLPATEFLKQLWEGKL